MSSWKLDKIGSTRFRSLTKAFTWEVISFSITLVAVYIVYGDWIKSLEFSLILNAIKFVVFYSHERVWKLCRWGKTR